MKTTRDLLLATHLLQSNRRLLRATRQLLPAWSNYWKPVSALVLVLDLPFPFCPFNGFAFSLFLEFPKRTFASRSLPTCLYVCPAHVLDSPSSIFRPAIRRSMLGRATIETRSFESGTALARAWTTCAASFINRTQMMSSRPGGRRFNSDRNSSDCPKCLQISSLWASCQVPSYFTTKWFSKSTSMTRSGTVIHVAGQFEFRSFPVFPDSHTFLTLASHFSIVPASTSSLHLSGDVMVSGNASFHLTTTRSQRLTKYVHASAPFPEPAPVTLSCDSSHVKAVKDVPDLGPLVCCVAKDAFYHRPGHRHHALFCQQAEIVTKVAMEKMFHRSTPLRPALKSVVELSPFTSIKSSFDLLMPSSFSVSAVTASTNPVCVPVSFGGSTDAAAATAACSHCFSCPQNDEHVAIALRSVAASPHTPPPSFREPSVTSTAHGAPVIQSFPDFSIPVKPPRHATMQSKMALMTSFLMDR